MQSSSRMTEAVHVMTLVYLLGEDMKLTSESMARSLQINPVLVRRIVGGLKEYGLVEVQQGRSGTNALREANRVTLLDIYLAVEAEEDAPLFKYYDTSRSRCPVAQNLHGVLDDALQGAELAMKQVLAGTTMADILTDYEKQYGVTKEVMKKRYIKLLEDRQKTAPEMS